MLRSRNSTGRFLSVARRNAKPQNNMKTLAANHPIKTTLARYLAANTAAAWEQFAAACTTRGIDPELVIQRYCH